MLTAKSFFDLPALQLTSGIEQDFFSSLMARNKTYKTTFHNRFSTMNRVLLQRIRSGYLRATNVLDIGISSGISTLELYEDLRSAGCRAHIVATDILLDAWIVQVLPGGYALIDDSGFPLRFDVAGLTLKPWVMRSDYRSGLFLLRKAVNVIFTRRARMILVNPRDPRVRNVKLVTPRLCQNRDIDVCNDDIAQYNPKFSARFDFIRAANVMNRGYFPDSALIEMIRNVTRYLTGSGGGFLVVRTHEDHTNHGTLFTLVDGRRFEVATRFGVGSEIEDLVLNAIT